MAGRSGPALEAIEGQYSPQESHNYRRDALGDDSPRYDLESASIPLFGLDCVRTSLILTPLPEYAQLPPPSSTDPPSFTAEASSFPVTQGLRTPTSPSQRLPSPNIPPSPNVSRQSSQQHEFMLQPRDLLNLTPREAIFRPEPGGVFFKRQYDDGSHVVLLISDISEDEAMFSIEMQLEYDRLFEVLDLECEQNASLGSLLQRLSDGSLRFGERYPMPLLGINGEHQTAFIEPTSPSSFRLLLQVDRRSLDQYLHGYEVACVPSV